ncbi:ribulose 1,5-bisphosphate carboxylase [Methanocella sp. CWC-04]|uniref:Ribulose 1,5-bisphosphate carboxylase n=1 Tax=Methanooceanicella nereidis TaxID=2052831 RepID=A0AAP2REC4_9EURY|nr:RuBisCO large subunit C-terminal-like domain-containing protein [Methanocella sp. CWC-04]MCD1296119.1 ribulose 1,5-bisphosphate carboxylase [Methanocella sp. CWC-04]
MVKATYYVEADMPLEKAAKAIAAEQSTGTWTEVEYEKEVHEKLGARVLSAKDNIVEIDFPVEIFEPDNIPGILSVVAGNLFGLGGLNACKLIDVDFDPIVKYYNGPEFGIQEARKFLGVYDRPLVGTIIKPKVGLNPKRTAEVAEMAALGGLDLIKDDETLTDQKFCPLEDRLIAVMDKLHKVEDKIGKKCFYAVNITVGGDQIIERAERAKELGANMIMVDILTAGFSAVQALTDEKIGLPIHVHRTMHGALTRGNFGIAMPVIAKLTRMVGGTNLHIGTYSGKMERNVEEINYSRDILRKPWAGFKPMFPACSGGLYPQLVKANLDGYGIDVILQAGGGIHGHPEGTTAGAKAMFQAVDAWKKGVSIEEYARDHHELEMAIKQWGK